MMRKFVVGAAVLVVVALVASLSILRLQVPSLLYTKLGRGYGLGSTQQEAFHNDVKSIAHLGDRLVTLTDGQESATEIAQRLNTYDALLVVTAGRGGPKRRADGQPFISIANGGGRSTGNPCEAADRVEGGTWTELEEGETSGSASSTPERCDKEVGSGGLPAALAVPLQLMNAAAAGVERVLGRRLFPIAISTFERPGQGPYAIFDVSMGALLLDRHFASYVWAYDKPEVSYITGQLASRVFDRVASLLDGLPWAAPSRGAGTGGSAYATDSRASANDADSGVGVEGHGEHADGSSSSAAGAAAAGAGGSGPGGSGGSFSAPLSGILLRSGWVPTGHQELAEAAPQQRQRLALEHRRIFERGLPLSEVLSMLPQSTPDAPPSPSAAPAASAAAAAALAIAAAAVGVALPAAFASAPPLWFCLLCPSVLGLLAPVLINVALNQIAGALCSQLHLDDDACFDVLLGALGAGFVLSLASAVPIFFACRLPECAGRNVTAALRRAAQLR